MVHKKKKYVKIKLYPSDVKRTFKRKPYIQQSTDCRINGKNRTTINPSIRVKEFKLYLHICHNKKKSYR